MRTGFAAETIAKEASDWKADVVVVGSHGKGGYITIDTAGAELQLGREDSNLQLPG